MITEVISSRTQTSAINW